MSTGVPAKARTPVRADGVLEARGDVVTKQLYCPSKAELIAELASHFSIGGACGLFAIVHGADEDGAWEAFNPAAEDECMRWADIEGAGVYTPSQASDSFPKKE